MNRWRWDPQIPIRSSPHLLKSSVPTLPAGDLRALLWAAAQRSELWNSANWPCAPSA